MFEQMARRRGQRKGHLYSQGGVWYLRYRVDTAETDSRANQRRVRVTVPIALATGPAAVGKREAQRIAWDEYLSKLDQSATRPCSMRTLQEFVTERFEPDVYPSLKESGRIFYQSILRRHVLPELGPLRLREIDAGRVQKLLNAKLKAKLSTQTVKHIRNCLSAILRHAKAMGWLSGELPTAMARLPEMRRKERRALRWDQVCDLARALPAPASTLVVFLALSGLRIGEATGLRWKRLNLTTEPRIVDAEAIPPMCVAVRENYVRGAYQSLKTQRSSRNVPIPAWFAPTLLALRAASKFQSPSDPVFSARNGRPIDEHNLAARKLKPAAKALGMPWVSWHCLRHTNSTLADAAGLSVAERQRILGHAAGEMSLHYTHAELEQIRARWESAADPRLLQ
jgi:integrase